MTPRGILANLRLAWGVLRHFGIRWALFRLRYAWRLRSGAMVRRTPRSAWADVPPASSPVRLLPWPDTSRWPAGAGTWGDRCVRQADAVAAGEFELFFHERMRLGFPPNWRRNPYTGQIAPHGVHWSILGDFNYGDIKAIWEPSRFSWAFALVRAYARTGDDRHVETFWRLLADWCQQNPPNDGVNWKCGQEASFRLMATSFAVAQFARSPATTPERLEAWSRLVTATGRRIAANLDYALSQSNNHGPSECAGLLTAALLSDESTETRAWRERAMRELHDQFDCIVYEDGGFSQYSVMYHRVLLDDLYWVITVLRAAGSEPPAWLLDKVRRALDFLAVLVDPDSGGAPLLGSNDGSRILPLDECDYGDLRGTIQAGFAVLDAARALPAGPWDESAFWLAGRNPASLAPREYQRPERWHAAAFGAFQWLSGEARLLLFCPTRFRHRVVQADMLHVDLWWRGRAIAHDAGSYSYNAHDRFAGAMAKAAAHNVPMLAGIEPLRHAGRFFYLPWPHGTAGWTADQRQFRATHDAYGAAARIERRIESPRPGEFVVTDLVSLARPGRVRVHWLLADLAWQLDERAQTVTALVDGGPYTVCWSSTLTARPAVSLMRADPATARGWWSPHYLAAEPAVSLELNFDVVEKLEVSTRFAPGGE